MIIKTLLAGALGAGSIASMVYYDYIKRGMFRRFHGIFTIAVPADLDLYRSLLRKPLEMPERPIVGLFFIQYFNTKPWPMGPYKEYTLALRCKHNDEVGWHVKTMPVDKFVPVNGWWLQGWPKYVADDISFEPSNGGWQGAVTHKGDNKVTMRFTPGVSRELDPWEQEFLESGAAQLNEPLYNWEPAPSGPVLLRVMLEQVMVPEWQSELGTTTITIGTSEPWAGLIPPGAQLVSLYQRYKGGAILVPKLKGIYRS